MRTWTCQSSATKRITWRMEDSVRAGEKEEKEEEKEEEEEEGQPRRNGGENRFRFN